MALIVSRNYHYRRVKPCPGGDTYGGFFSWFDGPEEKTVCWIDGYDNPQSQLQNQDYTEAIAPSEMEEPDVLAQQFPLDDKEIDIPEIFE